MKIKSATKYVQILGISLSGFGLVTIVDSYPATAQVCNVFGCAQPGAGECNVFGCPNPGADPCSVFGCPPSPTGTSNNSNAPGNSRRSFTISNNTGFNVTALYLSPAVENSWGQNDLNGTLYSGNSTSYTLTGDCDWNVRAILSNGSELTQYRINTCTNSSYILGSSNAGVGFPNPAQNPSANNNFNGCMDRLMYEEFRAYTGPNADGWYEFNLPSNRLTHAQIQQAGFNITYPSFFSISYRHRQPVVRIQVATAEQAAQRCR
jgi:hypothetical protein